MTYQEKWNIFILVVFLVLVFIVWMEVHRSNKKPNGPHEDDLSADSFALKMKNKLAFSRNVKGRGGWRNRSDFTPESLSRYIREHIEKGDPVDVANIAMFASERGETILKLPAEQLSPSEQRAILKNPTGIASLINHHMMCELEADSVEPGAGEFHGKRQEELKAIALEIINQDPDCFEEHVLKFYGVKAQTKHPDEVWAEKAAIVMLRLARSLSLKNADGYQNHLIAEASELIASRPGNNSVIIEEERY